MYAQRTIQNAFDTKQKAREFSKVDKIQSDWHYDDYPCRD